MKNKKYPYYQLPKVKNLWDMICQRADEYGNNTAYTFRKGRKNLETKSFQQVHDEVERLGFFLKDKYPFQTHIAVVGENSYEWLLAFLGIVVSGNVAVPIDKELPEIEVVQLLKSADIEAVFCSQTYMDLVESLPKESVYSLKNIYDLNADKEAALSNLEHDDQLLACIFFTSGTSGKPKGVMLSQGNLASEINYTCQLFKLEGDSLSVLPFHHSFGLIVAVLMVFNYGYNNFLNRSLKTVKEDMLTAKPQTMFLVPLFVETFYKQIWTSAEKERKDKLLRALITLSNGLCKVGVDLRRKLFGSVLQNFGSNLTYIICGGAMLDPFYVKEFRGLGIEILNGYGTTECSPCTAVNRNYYHKDGSVGVIIPQSNVKIADDNEVLISGPHVMLGYYKDPEATKEVLVDGWYATGDLGFIDKNGFLTLTGRKKNLIITSNGENISPEELEGDFGRDPAVLEVLVYEHDRTIVAEIYPDEKYIEDVNYFENLRIKVNAGRPSYKQVGRVILRKQEFIKNTNKKIVRHKNIRG